MSVLTGSALGLFGVIIGEKLLIDLSSENTSPLKICSIFGVQCGAHKL